MRGTEIAAVSRKKSVTYRSGMRAKAVSTSVRAMLIMYQAVSLDRYKYSTMHDNATESLADRSFTHNLNLGPRQAYEP